MKLKDGVEWLNSLKEIEGRARFVWDCRVRVSPGATFQFDTFRRSKESLPTTSFITIYLQMAVQNQTFAS